MVTPSATTEPPARMSVASANAVVLSCAAVRLSRVAEGESRCALRSADAPSARTPVTTAPTTRPLVTTIPAHGTTVAFGAGGGGVIGTPGCTIPGGFAGGGGAGASGLADSGVG